jgi:hypothetical protein
MAVMSNGRNPTETKRTSEDRQSEEESMAMILLLKNESRFLCRTSLVT